MAAGRRPRAGRERLVAWGLGLAALALGGLLGVAAPGPEDRRVLTRRAMQAIFRALTDVYPLSLDPEAFGRPEERERIRKALRDLSEHAEQLRTHARELNPSFDLLRRSFVEDARETLQRFEAGHTEWARFTLQQMTEDCFACHSRLPAEPNNDLARRFHERVRPASLPPELRAKLWVATRQFDEALVTYEALFASEDFSATDIYLMGAFEEYLKICLRVRQNPDRAARALDKVRARADTPEYLRDLLGLWIEALRSVRERLASEDPLATARVLVREAKLRKRFPADHRGLVEFVAASSLLHRFVDATNRDLQALSEAYYWLGIAEAHISRSAWISETEFFLETSIRLAPGAPFARDAYAFLEEYTVAGYTGSAGARLPAEVRATLDELRRLIDAAETERAKPPG